MLQKVSECGNKVALKRIFTTRWLSRNDALNSLRFAYIYVMIFLPKLHFIPNEKDEKTVSGGVKKYLEKLDSDTHCLPE